jgi:hypothetical protein
VFIKKGAMQQGGKIKRDMQQQYYKSVFYFSNFVSREL